jgi:hypothetical protein
VAFVGATVKDARGAQVGERVDMPLLSESTSASFEIRGLAEGEYTVTLQGFDEHGTVCGSAFTAGLFNVTSDTSTLPSFVPTGVQVSF